MANLDERHAVQVQFVCGNVPVLNLDSSSVWEQYAANLLQWALNTFEKSKSLYEECLDNDIVRECKGLGYPENEIMPVRLKAAKLAHVRAVGFTKRSVPFSLVMAIAVQEACPLNELWAYLRSVPDLTGSFQKILSRCQRMVRPSTAPPHLMLRERSRSRSRTPREGKIEVQVVCGHVPVVSMPKDHEISSTVSWLLQTVTECTGKADSQFEYYSNEEVRRACYQHGFTTDDTSIAHLLPRNLRDVVAVGLNGKRSVMLALVVAMLMRRDRRDSLFRAIRAEDSEVEKKLRSLVPLPVKEQPKSEDESEEDMEERSSEEERSPKDLSTQTVPEREAAVRVYELSARLALEHGEFEAYGPCGDYLEELYDLLRPVHYVSGEFLAYRLIWLTMHMDYVPLACFRRRHLEEMAASQDKYLDLAKRFCSALETENLHLACRLSAATGRSTAMGCLMARALDQRHVRLQLLAAICKAYHQRQPDAQSECGLVRLLTDVCVIQGDEGDEDLPLVIMGDPPHIVADETSMKANNALAQKCAT